MTHDQTEAMTLGDRVAVMRAGVIQQVDSPKVLYEDPANLFVAGFIGSPAMNFLPATVEGDAIKLPFGDAPLPKALSWSKFGGAARTSSPACAPSTSRTRAWPTSAASRA